MTKDPLNEHALTLAAAARHDPHLWALSAWDWGHGELADTSGPFEWQTTVSSMIRDHLTNEKTRFTPLKLAIASGHGIGKSALLGMLTNWAMSTCVGCRVNVTANTGDQLKMKTAPEIAKWFRNSISEKWFDRKPESIKAADPTYADSWRLDFATWDERRPESFAGLHNKGKRILLIMDEASVIPPKIWEVTDGATTDTDTEIIWLAFGNPTSATGRFKDCFTNPFSTWKTISIDSRTVPSTNKELLNNWIKEHGEDSDFCRVRIYGKFPKQSSNQFISEELIEQATKRAYRPHEQAHAAGIIGVDPAWSGDDSTVIMYRRGNYCKKLYSVLKNDNDADIANIIARYEDDKELNVKGVFIDAGYGTGIYSFGKTWGRNWQLIYFGGASSNEMYLNKRMEMWAAVKDWLRDGGILDRESPLIRELTCVDLVTKSDGKVRLEDKAEVKKKLGGSPNEADALALTFARPVVSLEYNKQRASSVMVRSLDNYYPF